MSELSREQMNVVIVGHVDHGKSTLIGRLLSDTDSLPKGKLEAVKANCARNSKPFEYAFLLDALKDEQSQGITIDTARSFFKSRKRDYIIIDAPGHIEFLKNMITGAARAEAALLVIDAKEGIRENSKRHGYMLSFLGIKNITVCVNKMDLVDYSQSVFNKIKDEYSKFLHEVNLKPMNFIPISAREGDNIAKARGAMNWYKGLTVLDALDHFIKAAPRHEKDLRLPVQDIYKFTSRDDDRRIVAGRIDSGSIKVGDEVVFYPSQKRSNVTSIEGFNLPAQEEAIAGQSTGVCLQTQIYIKPGEIMCKAGQRSPHVTSKFKASIFWMGKHPFIKDKNYKLKLATQQVPVILSDIISVLDAAQLSQSNKAHVDRHDVAECVLETLKPVAFDEITQIPETSRFVIVDNYEITGGGIILEPVFDTQTALNQHIKAREFSWERSHITPDKRSKKYQHKSALVVITGQVNMGKIAIAKALEEELFRLGKFTYFLGVSNDILAKGLNQNDRTLSKLEHIQQLGELSHIFTDAGLLLVTSISDIDEYDIEMLKTLNQPNKTFIVNVGECQLNENQIDLQLAEGKTPSASVKSIVELLVKAVVIDPEYSI